MATAHPITVTEKLKEAFWMNVRPGPKDKCWLWGRDEPVLSYGILAVGDVRHLAHRVSFAIHFWEPPVDMMVCHHCDNPPCVNPSHLFLGTGKDNSQDSARKGRCALQRRGTLRPTQRIDIPTELYLVAQMKVGRTDKELAEELNVWEPAIHLVRRRYWQVLGVRTAFTKTGRQAGTAWGR